MSINSVSSTPKQEHVQRTTAGKSNVQPTQSSTLAQTQAEGAAQQSAGADDQAGLSSRASMVAESSALAAAESTESQAVEGGEPKAYESGQNYQLFKARDCEPDSDAYALAQRLAETEPEDDEAAAFDKLTVLRASEADNKIQISAAEDGGIIVDIDGEELSFTKSEARYLIIDGGDGNDTIEADENLRQALYVVGGKGDDRISTGAGSDFVYDNYGANNISTHAGDDIVVANQLDFQEGGRTQQVEKDDRNLWEKIVGFFTGEKDVQSYSVQGNVIDGGDGRDYLEGGLADDYITGGDDNDYIYGLDGNDILRGGDGNDYLDGGHGDDDLAGHKGDDILFGGYGADKMDGGRGNDRLYGGFGADTIRDTEGEGNIARVDSDDTVDITEGEIKTSPAIEVPTNITIKGNAGYQARVRSDLEALAAMGDSGHKMLQSLGGSGQNITIQETGDGNNCVYYSSSNRQPDGTPGKPSSPLINYNRSTTKLHNNPWGERPGLVGLYHEMVHAYDATQGIADPNYYTYATGEIVDEDAEVDKVQGVEIRAVGLEGITDRTQPIPGMSENSIRSDLGLARRERY